MFTPLTYIILWMVTDRTRCFELYCNDRLMLPKPIHASVLIWWVMRDWLSSASEADVDDELSLVNFRWRCKLVDRVIWIAGNSRPDRFKIFNAIDRFMVDVVADFFNWNDCKTDAMFVCVRRSRRLYANCPIDSPCFFDEVCAQTLIFNVSCSGFGTKNVKLCSQTGASVSFLTDVNRVVLPISSTANGSGISSEWICGKSAAESRYTVKTALLIFGTFSDCMSASA